MKSYEGMWVITVTSPTVQPDQVIGPFHTREEASAWEDKHLDAEPGARAAFVQLTDPHDLITDGGTD